MKQDIPWNKLSIEAFVIVASILLAFGIDAWWDTREQQRNEKELLSSILQNVQASREASSGYLAESAADQDLARSFLKMSDAELSAIPVESAIRLIRSLWRPNTRQVSQGTLVGVLSSERLELIEDPRISETLGRWLTLVTELDERAKVLSEFEVVVTTGLARHEGPRRRFLEPFEANLDPDETVDLRTVRADTSLVSAIVALVNARKTYRVYALRLDGVFNELADALQYALQTRG
jgi:hypothetical protein